MYKYDIEYLTSPVFNGEIFEVCNVIAIFVQLIQTGIVMGVVVGVKSKWWGVVYKGMDIVLYPAKPYVVLNFELGF